MADRYINKSGPAFVPSFITLYVLHHTPSLAGIRASSLSQIYFKSPLHFGLSNGIIDDAHVELAISYRIFVSRHFVSPTYRQWRYDSPWPAHQIRHQSGRNAYMNTLPMRPVRPFQSIHYNVPVEVDSGYHDNAYGVVNCGHVTYKHFVAC